MRWSDSQMGCNQRVNTRHKWPVRTMHDAMSHIWTWDDTCLPSENIQHLNTCRVVGWDKCLCFILSYNLPGPESVVLQEGNLSRALQARTCINKCVDTVSRLLSYKAKPCGSMDFVQTMVHEEQRVQLHRYFERDCVKFLRPQENQIYYCALINL